MARFFAAPESGVPVPGDEIDGEWIHWGRHIVWGNVSVEGGLPLPGSSAWSLAVTWGDKDAAATPIVWGVSYDDDNIVWSTGLVTQGVWLSPATNRPPGRRAGR